MDAASVVTLLRRKTPDFSLKKNHKIIKKKQTYKMFLKKQNQI